MATLAVHSVESLLDRKRSMAALLASGTPLRVLERSQRYEIALVTIPMAVLGVALGSLPTWLLGMSPTGPLGPLIGIVDVVLTLALVWVAIVLAVRFVRPWLRRATEPTNLRTE